MIDFEKWDKAVDDANTFCKKKKVRVTETDGTIYEGLCMGYHEDEDSNELACWAISVGGRSFLQEDVESIEFID
ncbi:MAG: hypothetical protein ACI4I2_12635 [Oscillospiraceae bacterium]